MKKLLAFVTLALAGGALAVALTACGSEQAVSLGKPSQGTTTATTGEQTGSVPRSLASVRRPVQPNDGSRAESRRGNMHDGAAARRTPR